MSAPVEGSLPSAGANVGTIALIDANGSTIYVQRVALVDATGTLISPMTSGQAQEIIDSLAALKCLGDLLVEILGR